MKALRSLSFTVLASVLVACSPTSTATPTLAPTQIAATATTAPTIASTLAPTATLAAPTPTTLPYTTPDWFKTSVLYQIFVRSFYDSNGDGIGDLAGITQKLDYIQSLGANTIWLTPIFASPSYHGYDTTDYMAINPDFGTEQDLADLVGAVHARGMHIILDYVASHTSNQHPYFKDAYANPKSVYSSWYIWKDPKNLTYQSFFGEKTLPSINHGSAEANAYFIDVAKRWMDLNGDGDYTDGIDGWRCDYALGSPHGFWKQLRAALKPLNPNVLLLGEVWVEKPTGQVDYYPDQFDALFDFPLYAAMMGKQDKSGDGVLAGGSAVSIPIDDVEVERKIFPEGAIPVRFLSNHDVDRLATELDQDAAREQLAALLLATLDGTPMVYYGEELGMAGHKGGGPLYDEYRREPMDWFAGAGAGTGQTSWFKPLKYTQPDDGVSVEEEDKVPGSLLEAYRRFFALRAANPALAEGDYRLLPVDPAPGVWAFWRYTAGQQVAVLFNFKDKPATIALDLTTAPGPLAENPTDLLTGAPLTLDPSAVNLPAASALVLDWTP
jgi:glycosidase